MERYQKKSVKRLTLCFLIFFAIHLFEEMVYPLLNGNSTMELMACGGGIIILLLYIRYINKPIEWIAFPFVWKKFRNGVCMAFIMNIIPVILVYAVEMFHYHQMDGSVHLSVYYDKTAHALSAVGPKEFIMWMALGLGVGLVHAIFYELTFRGLFFSLSAKTFKFGTTNVIQSILYTAWFLVMALKVLVYAFNQYSREQFIRLIIFIIVYELLTAYKLGILRNASGSVWVCIFDHLAFGYIFDIFHVQYTTPSNFVMTDYKQYERMIAYQAIALVLTLIYNNYKTKKRKEREEAEATAKA